ncbi:MAG: T9SS type A sorting domain-containing protein [Cytophagaceae bacterium]|nr:T9SS type A sorting domain-containing protein [Cytophagaceae bacterium]
MKKIVYLLLLTLPGFAQKFTFRPDSSAQVRAGGRVLPNAWAGGLNAAQYSRLRLDADTTADLVVFDRAGQRLSTYLAVRQPNGQFAWRYAPQYEAQFPAGLTDWLLLVDYDGDGRRDLFSRAPLGVRVFRNVTTSTGAGLRWEKVADPVYSIGNSGEINLQVTPTDVPAITDLDNDGDLDLMAFDISGIFVEYHRNESVETSGKRGLVFRKINFCWGNFWKEHCRDFRFDIDCKTGRFGNGRIADGRQAADAREEATLHAGNSLLVTDLTGDGRKDVLFGHITCQNVAFMPNTGSLREALFQTVSYEYPTLNPILFPVFPAVFQEDLDFDGRPDIVAAPNTTTNEGNVIDYRASNWFYQNTGAGPSTTLTLRQTNFLQDGMIDLGENAVPALLDLDGDGDPDLLVGYGGVRSANGYRGGIAFYRNIGTAQRPLFDWQTDDYLGLAQKFLMTDVKPFVADVNGDKVPDLGFAANTFKGFEMRYLPNRGSRGGAFTLSADEAVLLPRPDGVGAGDSPLFYDIDVDGKVDLLVGKAFQNVEFYRNTGTNAAPAYTLVTEDFGGLPSNYLSRGLALTAADLDADGRDELLTLDGDGLVRIYKTWTGTGATALVADTLRLDDGMNAVRARLVAGAVWPAVADLDADGKPDLLLGTVSGGIRLLRNTSTVAVTGVEPPASGTRVYPNPTERYVVVQTTAAGQADVLSLAGQVLLTRTWQAGSEQLLDLGTLPNGLYLIRVRENQGARVWKVVLRQ